MVGAGSGVGSGVGDGIGIGSLIGIGRGAAEGWVVFAEVPDNVTVTEGTEVFELVIVPEAISTGDSSTVTFGTDSVLEIGAGVSP